jgi:hypothetical protein
MINRKAIVYIDGFNLYHGLRNKKWAKYYWLNLEKFSKAIIPNDCEIKKVRYFTSRIKGFADDPNKPVRQAKYLDTIVGLNPLVEITYGNYQAFQSHCRHCDNFVYCPYCLKPHVKPNEKKTDVNIATALLIDAMENQCEVQILVSGDGDYENLLKEHRRVFPKIELIIAFPPMRKNNQLIGPDKCTSGDFIKEDVYKYNQFNDRVAFKDETGRTVTIDKPPSWV